MQKYANNREGSIFRIHPALPVRSAVRYSSSLLGAGARMPLKDCGIYASIRCRLMRAGYVAPLDTLEHSCRHALQMSDTDIARFEVELN